MILPYKGYFKCIVISPNALVYENEIRSLFVVGDKGEYELLSYHYPLIGVLVKSDIIIDWNEKLPIRGGVIRFFANECVIMVDEELTTKL